MTNKASSTQAHVSDFFAYPTNIMEDRRKRSRKSCVRGDDREVKSTIALIFKQWMAFIKFHISVIIYSNSRRLKRLTNVQVQDFSVSRDENL